MKTALLLKRLIMAVYAVLLCAAFAYMEMHPHDEFRGLLLTVLTLPWCFIGLPLSLGLEHIWPGFNNTHGDMIGTIVFPIGIALNFLSIHLIFRAIAKNSGPTSPATH